MNTYIYRWSITSEEGLALDLRTPAPSVLVAQREVHRFLVEHNGASWTIEYVTRETSQAHRPPMAASQPAAAR